MDISIILVSYNTKELTENCINSIYEYTKDVNYEIIVVDNNSTDGSVEMLEQKFINIKLIKNKDNKGFGAANNIGIRQSMGKYIFCLNTDTVIIDNSIKILFDYMENNQNVGACGGQLFDKDMNITYSVGNFPSFSRIFFQYAGLKYIFKKYWNKKLSPSIKVKYDTPTKVDYIIGADLMIRKSILDTIGLFDENIFLYGEESDLCFRIKKNSNDIMFIPDSRIIHFQGQSSKNINAHKIVIDSLMYWYKKNISKFSSYLLKYTMFINFFMLFIFTQKNKYIDLAFYAFNKK